MSLNSFSLFKLFHDQRRCPIQFEACSRIFQFLDTRTMHRIHHSSTLPTRLMCCIKAIFLPILWKLWKISIISMENKWSACLVHILWVPHFNHIQQKIRAHSWNNARYTNTTIINHVFPFSKHLLPHWSQSVTKLDRELPKQWHISTVGYSEVFFFGLLLIAQECERVRTQRAVAIHRPSYPSHSYFRQLRD